MQTARKGRRGRIVWILAGSLFGVMMSQTALATVHPGTKSRFNVSEVPDSELAKMRGKFVAGGNVVYFGVEMATSWITANNERFSGNVILSMGGDHNRFVPTITYRIKKPEVDPNAATDAGTRDNPGTIDAGGLDKTAGIVQSIQIAGAANKVRNETSITIDKSKSGHVQPLQAGSDSGQDVTRRLNGNDLALEFDVPGQGRVRQSISNKLGLKQQVQLSSSFNDIANRMNIVARVAGIQNNLNIDNVRRAMGSVTALRGIGRF